MYDIHCKKNYEIPGIFLYQTFLGLEFGALFPVRKSLVSDIPAGDGNIANLFYSVLDECTIFVFIPALLLSDNCNLCTYFKQLHLNIISTYFPWKDIFHVLKNVYREHEGVYICEDTLNKNLFVTKNVTVHCKYLKSNVTYIRIRDFLVRMIPSTDHHIYIHNQLQSHGMYNIISGILMTVCWH